MKKVILGIGLAIGLSACCNAANAGLIPDDAIKGTPHINFNSDFNDVVYQTDYDASFLGITSNGSLEYQYINRLFGTTFTDKDRAALKNNKDTGNSEGDYANSYKTSIFQNYFSNLYLSGDAIDCQFGCFLAVKDGMSDPDRPYFFFDISDWDGTELMEGSNMWDYYLLEDGVAENNIQHTAYASISHVSIWQGQEPEYDKPNPVPEPMPLMLMGIGLIGIGFSRKYSLTR